MKMRAEEETTFISLIVQGKRKRSRLDEERKKFGRIAILSNIKDDGEKIYLLCRQRKEVEVAFDAMENDLIGKTSASDLLFQ